MLHSGKKGPVTTFLRHVAAIKFHPSLFLYPFNPTVGSWGGWSLSQRSSGERRGSPWTSRQSITGPHRDKRDKQPHKCSHSLLRTIIETLVNPRIHWENMQTPHRKLPGWGSNLEPSCCGATVLTTTLVAAFKHINSEYSLA